MVAVVGDFEEVTIDIVLFLGAAALLFNTTHQRSNLARWLLVLQRWLPGRRTFGKPATQSRFSYPDRTRCSVGPLPVGPIETAGRC
jgi:hypothetical protein